MSRLQATICSFAVLSTVLLVAILAIRLRSAPQQTDPVLPLVPVSFRSHDDDEFWVYDRMQVISNRSTAADVGTTSTIAEDQDGPPAADFDFDFTQDYKGLDWSAVSGR